MHPVLFISGVVEIILSLILGVLFIYAAFKVFSALTKGIDEIEELKKNNVAVGILIGAIFISVTIVIKNAMEPAFTVFMNTLRNPEAGTVLYLKTVLIMVSHFLISGILGFTAVYLALKFFIWLTSGLDEMAELKNNNIAVGVLMAAVVICAALLIQPGIVTLLDALIPYPESILKSIGQ